MNQLERIIGVTGKPSQEDVDSIQSAFASSMLESITMDVETKSLKEMYPKAKSDNIDLMKQMLQFNPEKRITSEKALKHKYVSMFHNPDDEPECKTTIKLYFDDNTKYSISDYRERLYADIRLRKKKIKEEKSDKSQVIKPEVKQSPQKK